MGKIWIPGVKDWQAEPQILSRAQLVIPNGKDWGPHEKGTGQSEAINGETECCGQRKALRGRAKTYLLSPSWAPTASQERKPGGRME